MCKLPSNKPGNKIQYPPGPMCHHSNRPKQPAAITEHLGEDCVAAIVIQHLSGTAHLVIVMLHPSLNAQNHINKIREEYRWALCRIKRSSWSSYITKSIIGTAQIHQVIRQDFETTLEYPTVFIGNYSCSDFLSHVWQQSEQLRHYNGTVLLDYLTCSPSSPQDCQGKRAIVIRQVLSKTKVAMILLGLLILGSLVGVAVGISTGRADVAVAVTAGIFAFATVLQGLVAWLAA